MSSVSGCYNLPSLQCEASDQDTPHAVCQSLSLAPDPQDVLREFEFKPAYSDSIFEELESAGDLSRVECIATVLPECLSDVVSCYILSRLLKTCCAECRSVEMTVGMQDTDVSHSHWKCIAAMVVWMTRWILAKQDLRECSPHRL